MALSLDRCTVKYFHHAQTLPHTYDVCALDVRCTEDGKTALLLTGDYQGNIAIYLTPFTRSKPLQFTLLKRFHANLNVVTALHFHRAKPLFLSASRDKNARYGVSNNPRNRSA